MAKKFETPKGTRDFLPQEMQLRSMVFDKLRNAFQRFGFDELDTPAFEYLEVLTLKAGPQAEQEIYAFDDKSGRRLGLRFDLTSSTGRFAANHPELKRPIYRFQIGKVWRYDRPGAGRYREFYQADADILGSYSMDCEVELFLLVTSVLKEFGLSQSMLLLNHRKILEAQIRLSGIPMDKKSLALRALDKLDKIGVDGVLEEARKYEVPAEAFQVFLKRLGIQNTNENARDYLDWIAKDLLDDEIGTKGVEELRYIIDRATDLGFIHQIRIDPTLARGLDYYTGPIFEVKAGIGQGLLSFAGGGRYDDLIGLYGGQEQGAVGFSFGVERLIEILKEQHLMQPLKSLVLVCPIGKEHTAESVRIANLLRMASINTRFSLQAPSPGKHLSYAEATGIDWIMFVGEKEITEQKYTLKQLSTRKEISLSMDEMISYLCAEFEKK